jgi:hypothetical protein
MKKEDKALFAGAEGVIARGKYETCVRLIEIDDSGSKHRKAVVLMKNGYEMLVTRVPCTTKTSATHIGENIMKSAHYAFMNGHPTAGYSA